MTNQIFDFVGGDKGIWKISSIETVIGSPTPFAPFLDIIPSSLTKRNEGIWSFKGVKSNLRYTERHEKEQLTSIQAALGRKEATCAALIPIRKTEAWWSLAQDERRQIFEEQSKHTSKGLQYLPAIARSLYHSWDIGEPFDFLTWFEYAPEHADDFEELVATLRQTEEWKYVDWEIDIRMVKNA